MAQDRSFGPIEWREWDFEKTGERSWEIGPLRLWARRTAAEWHLSWARFPDPKERAKADAPSDAAWWRWTAPEGTLLKIAPCLPALALVAAPQNPFRILPGERARVYVSVPVGVRASVPGEKDLPLVEVPTEGLSRTWIGTPQKGELAWWTRTRARRDPAADPALPHIATAPLVLSNRSAESLLIEKIFLRLPFLSVFEAGEELWTDASHIIHKGPGEYETVQEEGEPPDERTDGRLLAAPRARPKTGLAALSFSPLKALSELGF